MIKAFGGAPLCSRKKLMQLSPDSITIHAASSRDILPALQAQLQNNTFDKHSLTFIIKAVLNHPLLLDDCILVCGLLCHKNNIIIDDVENELRYLWLQTALTRAKLQDGTPTDTTILLEFIRRALLLDEHVLVARCLECTPPTTLSEEFVPLLMEVALLPNTLVQFRLRELVKKLYTTSSHLIPQISAHVNMLPDDFKIKYQLLTMLQQCPLEICKQAMRDRALASAVSECLVFAEKDKMKEWISCIEDDQLALMVCTHLLEKVKHIFTDITSTEHPLIQLTICDLTKTRPSLAFLQNVICHKDSSVRIRALDHLIHINTKDNNYGNIKCIIKRTLLEALLGESPEFRQQFIRCFADLLKKDSDFVNDILVLILNDLNPKTTPFPRLSLTLSLAQLANFTIDPSKLTTLISKSSFGSIQALAFDLIKSKDISPIDQGLLDNVWNDLIHPRACINEGAAMIVRLLFMKGLLLVDDLLAQLECNVPNPSGIILAIKLIYEDVHQDINTRLKHSLFDLIDKAESIASHPTPEGLDLSRLSLNDDMDELDDTNAHDDCSSSQSWRTIREASSLLALISAKTNDYSIFEQLIQLMLRLRHPGAFCSLVEPLTTLASMFSFDCTSLVDKHLSSFPEVSTTRRSAGLPLCLKALLLGNVQRHQREDKTGRLQSRECKKVSDSLIALVMKDNNNMHSVSLVHALNCLRALVREARLSPYLTHSVPTLTKFCFLHFSSKEWSIRNSASMLFFALIVKVFGSDHNRVRLDERELRRKVPGFVECIIELITTTCLERDENDISIKDEGCFQIMCILARIRLHSRQCKQLFSDYLMKLVEHREIRVRVKAVGLLRELEFWKGNVVVKDCWNAIHGHMLVRQENWNLSLLPPSIYTPRDDTSLDDITKYFERCHDDPLINLARKSSIPRLCQLIEHNFLTRTSAVLHTDLLHEPSLLQCIVENNPILTKGESNVLQSVAISASDQISHFGLTVALLNSSYVSLEFAKCALNAAPLNDEIIRLTLPRLVDTDNFLSLIDKYGEERMTDVARLAACTAYTLYLLNNATVTNNSPSQGLNKEEAGRCKQFLWDDDESVRQLMANKLSTLWKIEGELSVANALWRIYTLFPTPLYNKMDGEKRVDVEKGKRGVLFEEEPRNVFWDEGWEKLIISQISTPQSRDGDDDDGIDS